MSYATVLAHEYVHSLEIASEDYKALRDAVFSSRVYARYLKSAGTGERLSLTHDQYVQQIITQYGFKGDNAVERAEQEALAKVLARDFLRNEARLVELARQDRNLFMRLWAWVRRMIARLGKSEETLKLEALFRKAAKASTVAHNAKADAKVNVATDTASETQKHPADGSGVQYSLEIVHSNGRIEVLPDARDITDEQVTQYLKLAKASKLYDSSYIPVRKDTPQVLIYSLAQIGETIENRSLVMQVRKARGAMGNDGGNRASKMHGRNVRKHGLSITQILEILSNLDNPTTIVKQTNRKDKNGNLLPDNFAVFVEYKNETADETAEGLAIVEFNASIDPRFIGKEYGDTQFHTIVTLLEPDTMRNGMPFDYLVDEVLANPNNIEVEIVREPPTRSANRETHPNTSSELLSKDSILDPSGKSNPQSSEDSSDDDSVQHSLPDQTASEYLKKMLADEAIAKATKAQIYADSPLYDVLHDEARFAAAREIFRDRDQLVDVVKRVSKGEAATAEEITAMILMQNAATTGAEQANASYIVATAARVAGRALRAFDRHNKLYTQMTPEDRAVALLEDTKADALQDAFRLQNRFIDYKLHRGAGDFIDQVVLAFYAEAGVDQLSEKALGEKVIEIIKNAEDVLGADGAELRDRVKGRLLKAFENKDLVKYLHDLMKSGNAPIDAIRMAMNKAVHIKSMTNSELKTVIGYAEGVADLRIKWFEAESADEARQINVEIDVATSEMLDYIAEHMTISGVERMRSWRKTAMLSNVRTHFRNVVSNVAMLPIQRSDQKIAALLERSIFHKHGIRDHTFATWSQTKHGKQILDYVEKLADYEAMIGGRYLGYGTDVVATEKGRAIAEKDAEKLKEEYNFDFNANEIAMRRKMFGARENFLNRVADFNSRWLEKEDAIFYRRAFRSALGQLMVANKATEATELMIRNARAQALEAVFKADNLLYKTVQGLKNLSMNVDGRTIAGQRTAKVLQEALDTIIPFTKTPTNIVKAIFDHSVLGLAWTFARHVTHNVMNKSNESLYMDQVIMQYSKGIQGSLWTGVGFILGLAGLLVTDEEDDREYDELTGGTKYALKLGDVYISLDWMQPASASFLIGATVGESMKDANNGNLFLDALGGTFEAAMSTFDFAMDQSYFSSLKELFSGPAYKDFSFGADTVGGLAGNYITQFIPTLLGQTARAIDPVQRKVSTGEFFSTTLNTVLSRLPGASMLLEPRTSVWGDDVRRNNAQDDLGGWISNALQQYVLPSTVAGREYPGDNTTEELLSLFDRIAESDGSTTAIFNENDMKSWTDEDGKALDAKQYLEYDRTVRKAFKAALDDLVGSPEWSYMTDGEKADAVETVYSNIRSAAKASLKNGTADTANAEINALVTALSANGEKVGYTGAYTLTLSNRQFLPENSYLYNRYESAIAEHYEALVREESVGWFTFSKNGVDYKIRLNDCTPEERALAEESLKKRAVNHIRKLFEGADPAALEDALRSSNGHTAYKRLKDSLD